jgi:hypothetical protein
MVKSNSFLNNLNKFQQQKIWNFRNCHDENFGIFGMVMVKIGWTILTTETQFWPNGQKTVVIGLPPPSPNSP